MHLAAKSRNRSCSRVRQHTIHRVFASQRVSDMGDLIVSQPTGHFVLKASDEREVAFQIVSVAFNGAAPYCRPSVRYMIYASYSLIS